MAGSRATATLLALLVAVSASCTSVGGERAPRPAPVRAGPPAQQALAIPTLEGRPPVSAPQHSRLAYVAATHGGAGQDVFTVDRDGAHRRRLTSSGAATWPAWSPDGRRVAYQDGAGGGRVMVVWRDGSRPRVVARGGGGTRPAWSPDGARIALRESTGGGDMSRVVIHDLATGRSHPVTTPTRAWPLVESMDWAPDGRRIAFVGRSSTRLDDDTTVSALFTVRTDGTGLRRLTGTGDVATPDWSPDGRSILCTRTAASAGGEPGGSLWSVQADGRRTRRVPGPGGGGGREEQPVWSPDGRWVALRSDGPDPGPDAPAGGHGVAGVWLMRGDGSGARLVVRDASMPSLSPAAVRTPGAGPPSVPAHAARRVPQAIVFDAAVSGRSDLFVIRRGGTVSRLTVGGLPSWPSSSDGGLVHQAAAGGPSYDAAFYPSIWSARLDGHRRLRVLATSSGMGQVAWSPDGSRFAVTRHGQVSTFDLRRHTFSQVTDLGRGWTDAEQPAWSPDGRWVAFVRHRDLSDAQADLFVVRPDGTGLRRVTHAAGVEAQPDWSPDGAWIAYTHSTAGLDATRDVYAVRPDGSGGHPVLRTPLVDDAPSWSEDGRRIALYSDGPRPFGARPRPGIWTVDPDGGRPAYLLRSRVVTDLDW